MSDHLSWDEVERLRCGSQQRKQSPKTTTPPFVEPINTVGELLTLGELWVGDLTRSCDDARRGNLLVRPGKWRVGTTPTRHFIYAISLPFTKPTGQWKYRQTIPVEQHCGFCDSIGSHIITADAGPGVGRLSYVANELGEAVAIRVVFGGLE